MPTGARRVINPPQATSLARGLRYVGREAYTTGAGRGERESGDRPVVQPFPDGVLVAVVDGLGHGKEAATAARMSTGVLARCAAETPTVLVRRCHQALGATRGVVLSVEEARLLVLQPGADLAQAFIHGALLSNLRSP